MIYLDQGATFSPCGLYRYSLWRTWDYDGPTLVMVALNGSTAGASKDDPTIRRCVYFARREGCGRFVMVNAFGFCATDPKEMMRAVDPIGPDNDAAILAAAKNSCILVVAWGAHGGHRQRDRAVIALVAGHTLYCLGTTKDGHPRHPLYVPNDVPLISYVGRT